MTTVAECPKCKEAKPLTLEYFHSAGRGRLHRKCKACRCEEARIRESAVTTEYKKSRHKKWREKNKAAIRDMNRRSRLKSRYGITVERYEEMLAEQNGGCAICGACDNGGGRWDTLVVDHNSDTGEVRRLLCHKCNTAIGLFKHDPSLLQKAAEYLNMFQEGSGSGFGQNETGLDEAGTQSLATSTSCHI